MPVTAAAVVSAGVGLFKTISAAKQAKKDREEAERLKQPFYKIQDEYYQNRNIAAAQAEGGVPADIKNTQSSQRQQALSSSINAILRTGGNAGDLSRLNEIYNNASRSDAADDAQLHLKNIDYFTKQNTELAGQKTTQWAINEYQPYENKLKEITQRRAADKQNIYSGLGDIVGSLTAFGSKLGNKDPFTKDNYIPDKADASWLSPVSQGGGFSGSVADNYSSISTNAPQLNFNQ